MDSRGARLRRRGSARGSSNAGTTVESGLRGYLLTGRTDFLAPYTSGRQQFERALSEVAKDSRADPGVRATRTAQLSTARDLAGGGRNPDRAIAARAPAYERVAADQSEGGVRRFRRANARYHDGERSSVTSASRAREGVLVVIIVGLAALFGGLGSAFLERSSRREACARRREIADQRKQSEFAELLQVTRWRYGWPTATNAQSSPPARNCSPAKCAAPTHRGQRVYPPSSAAR